MTTRIRECDERISAGRLRKARQFLDAARTIREFADDEAEVGDAFVTLCIHAGIAAADAICCETLGNHLRALLQMKPRAEYGPIPVSAEQRKRAWRRAEKLVDAASVRRAS